jgi:hypothetical protein
MAGFEVIIYGRFWVIAEGAPSVTWTSSRHVVRLTCGGPSFRAILAPEFPYRRYGNLTEIIDRSERLAAR